MDEMDRRILEVLQNDFPLRARPYEILAERLEISCDELWVRLQSMTAEGVIRRIGPCLDSRKLGFESTLAAVSVAAGRVEQAAEVIGQFQEVTHSYLRDDRWGPQTHSLHGLEARANTARPVPSEAEGMAVIREPRFNIWFTIIATDRRRIEGVLEQIRSALSLERSKVLNLPARRLFKLDARYFG